MRRLALLAIALVALATGPQAWGSERQPTLAELEGEVMCPVCGTTLDQSNSAAARRIEAFVVRRIRAGDSKTEIKRKLVAEFGPRVLAAPERRGFDLLAWLLPVAGILAGALVLGLAARRWTRVDRPGPNVDATQIEPELERRLDEELVRFE